jgi:hypothetical protein
MQTCKYEAQINVSAWAVPQFGKPNKPQPMQHLRKTESLCLAALLASALPLAAQSTYVDAVEGGNTLVAPSAGGGASFTAGPLNTQGTTVDGLWDLRAFGNNATILQSGSTSAIDPTAIRLATSVSGLSPNTYEVYAYLWSDTSLNWRLGASLSDSAGQLTIYKPGDAGVTQFYSGTDATVLSSSLAVNPFTTGVMVAEGNRRLYQVSLGQITGTDFSVYIEPDRNHTLQSERTWYDGIGYSVVPEPSSLALVGLGMAGMMIRRRNS